MAIYPTLGTNPAQHFNRLLTGHPWTIPPTRGPEIRITDLPPTYDALYEWLKRNYGSSQTSYGQAGRWFSTSEARALWEQIAVEKHQFVLAYQPRDIRLGGAQRRDPWSIVMEAPFKATLLEAANRWKQARDKWSREWRVLLFRGGSQVWPHPHRRGDQLRLYQPVSLASELVPSGQRFVEYPLVRPATA